MRRLIITILSILVVTGLGLGPARAQEPIRIVSEEVENLFPRGVVFHIEAEGQDTITRVNLVHRFRGESNHHVGPPEFEPSSHLVASYHLPTEGYPPGAPILYYWDLRDQAGNVLITETRTFHYDDVRFDWQTLGHDEISVLWHEGEDKFGQELYDVANAALRQLETRLGARSELPPRIVVYPNHEEFHEVFPQAQEWVGGHAFPSMGLIVLVTPPESRSSMAQVVSHELCHLLFYHLTDNPYVDLPSWLNEGLAVYSEWDDHSYYELLVAQAAREDCLLPVGTLTGSFPADLERVHLRYAESYSLVKYLIDHYGWEKMAAYLKAFKMAKPSFNKELAFQEVFGLPFTQFVTGWRAELGARPEPVVIPTPPAGPPYGIRTTGPTLPTAEPPEFASTPTTTPSPQLAQPSFEGVAMPWFYAPLVSGIGPALALPLVVLLILLRRRR